MTAVFFAFAMTLAFVPAAANAAPETDADSRVSLISPTDEPRFQADDLDAYWTPERMASAKFPEVEETAPDLDAFQDLDLGETQLVEPVLPDSEFASPKIDHSYATGRIFYDDFNGDPSSCSASALASGNQSLVLTAAHCLYGPYDDPAGWSSNVVFVPGYDNGYEPNGTWTADYFTQTVLTSWADDGDVNRDVGMFLVNTNSSGQTLNQVVGGHGFATGQGYEVDLHTIGYPANHDNNEVQWHCWGQSESAGLFDDRIQMNCNFSHGASGGPWLLEYSASYPGLGLANGTQSTWRSSDGRNLSGYFDDVIWDFYTQMSAL
ncbi:trypsin-like serine peptidase [Glycomyces terrestris]|uniref:Peptidase n=1 Tax=Glycomyces terrestris TaxID=2493553 RepID=A0A426V462_9ACTN|nr:hypothetical protein [Glycomyces terrestris]RRS01608.1 hypothetical protein EIW28_02235 [Glycomyces terrestris]